MVMRPSSFSSGEVWRNRASSARAPSGSSTWKAWTSTGSRRQETGLPSTENFKSTSSASGPRGPWVPGSHCGNSSVIRRVPAASGIVSTTR